MLTQGTLKQGTFDSFAALAQAVHAADIEAAQQVQQDNTERDLLDAINEGAQ